jgi:hypothetical protein
MISVKEIWDFVEYITNKENEGNTTTPDQRKLVLKAANIDVAKRKYGLPEEYQPGMPLPKMGYEQTQKMIDDMHQFKYTMGRDGVVMHVDSEGRADIPSDYLHFVSGHVIENIGNIVKYNSVEHLSSAQAADRIGDSIKYPTIRDPIFETKNTYFQWYPKDVGQVLFTYIRLPQTPYYAYTVNEEDIQEYDPINSVHFEYPDDMFMDIVSVILGYVAPQMRDETIMGYSERRKELGK